MIPKPLVRLSAIIGLCVGLPAHLVAADWAEWLGSERDSVWRESGIVDRFPTNGLPIAWRVKVGAGYSAPAVADGRVYLTDRVAGSPQNQPKNPYMDRTSIPGVERVLCLDERTGKLLWQHEYNCPYNLSYPSGPRAMPQVSAGRVYTVGADGHLRCLDAKSGKLLWSHHYPTDFRAPTQTWGVASTPLISGDRIFCLVGGEGTSVMAFDKRTGEELWRSLTTKEPGYSSPMLIKAGGREQLIVWDSLAVSALDPRAGTLLWAQPFPTKMAHAIGTPRRLGDRLFVSSFFDGSMMLKLDANEPDAEVVWKIKGRNENNPESLQSLMSTPFLEGGYIYGVCGYGQLRCIKAETGERVWETLVPTTADLKPARWGTAFLVKNGDRFFIWNEKGDLILAKLSPAGYEEISRQHVLEPTNLAGSRPVVWSHPAFANGHVLVRNDQELVRVDLRKPR